MNEKGRAPATGLRLLVAAMAGLPSLVALTAAPAWAQDQLEIVGQFGGDFETIVVEDGYAYAGTYNQLLVLDLSSPAEPRAVGWTAPFSDGVAAIAAHGRRVYVALQDHTLHTIDVSNPSRPTEAGAIRLRSAIPDNQLLQARLVVSGAYVYLLDPSGGLSILDVSDPASMVEVGLSPSLLVSAPGSR